MIANRNCNGSNRSEQWNITGTNQLDSAYDKYWNI